MATLPALLKRLHDLHTQYAALAHEIADVERAIVETKTEPRKPHRKRAAAAEDAACVRETVKVLRNASSPLPRCEIAHRLGLTPWATAYRLKRGIAAGFIERDGSHYKPSNIVPASL